MSAAATKRTWNARDHGTQPASDFRQVPAADYAHAADCVAAVESIGGDPATVVEMARLLGRIVERARLVPCKDGGDDATEGDPGSMVAGKWRVESSVDGWIADARAALARLKPAAVTG